MGVWTCYLYGEVQYSYFPTFILFFKLKLSERRKSPTSNGVLVKSSSGHGFESATTETTTTTTTTDDDNATSALLRRHSLPGNNGCAITIPNGKSHKDVNVDVGDEDDDEEDEVSETAALTSSNKELILVTESQL